MIKIKGGVDRPPITKEELHGCMGLPMYSIAAKLFPNMPEQDRNDLMDEMGVFENDYLRERGAKLFDGIERVIEETSKNVPIFISGITISSRYKAQNSGILSLLSFIYLEYMET